MSDEGMGAAAMTAPALSREFDWLAFYDHLERMTYDQRHDARYLCGCGAHLVTAPLSRLPLGCAWHRHVPGRWGVIWAQAERQWGAE